MRYPARFILIAAMNPCRCGYIGHPTKGCICSVLQVQSYRRKISGPLLDRIDLRVEVGSLKPNEMLEVGGAESSKEIQKRVMAATKIQEVRYRPLRISSNARLSPDNIKINCSLNGDCERLLRRAIESKGYTARSIHRIIRVARTIADLDNSTDIRLPHLAESVQFHQIERLDEL